MGKKKLPEPDIKKIDYVHYDPYDAADMVVYSVMDKVNELVDVINDLRSKVSGKDLK